MKTKYLFIAVIFTLFTSSSFAAQAIDPETGKVLPVIGTINTVASDADYGDITVSGGVWGIDADSVVLATDTTGNYVASLVAGTGIDVGAAAEGGTPTVDVDTTEIGTTTWGSGSAIVHTYNASGGTDCSTTYGDGTMTYNCSQAQTGSGAISSTGSITTTLDSDNNGSESFIIKDGAAATIFTLTEAGALTNVGLITGNAGAAFKNGATSGGFAEIYEDSDSGVNKYTITSPTTLTADQTCTFENDASFIPDSCVGDGVDGGGLATTDIDTSSELDAIVTDNTGSGALVFANTPTLVTPVLGAATGTSLALSGGIGQIGGSTGVSMSAAAGVLTVGGIGGANNENLTINFETDSNRATISSTTNAAMVWGFAPQFNANATVLDNNNFIFGSGTDSQIQWDTADTNDSLKLGLVLNSANSSGNLLITELADIETNFSAAQVANPTLRIQSADATTIADYITIAHNQTDAVIATGSGNLNLTPNGAVVAVTGALTVTTDITSSDTGNIGWTPVDGTDNTTGDAQCTSACVFGVQNATGSAVTGIVSCTDATADTAVCAGSS